jgi:hypothetical protein
VQLLEEVCSLGSSENYICQKSSSKIDQQQPSFSAPGNNNGASSDDDDEDDDVASTHSGTVMKHTSEQAFAEQQ